MLDKLFLLIAGHYLADFPLQGDHIAKTKNRNRPIDPDSVPPGQITEPIWMHSLLAHGFIHGLVVYIITGSLIYAVAEVLFHMFIDFGKCENYFGPSVDQCLHILTKVFYLV